eukprot:TRINITY_DN5712_c0_g1_i1.p1 TRINITY_DN5712_c0_g1~~TRINITY_DN5712_c0_g1_i1.p1  ORF type:complete len:583 (+),score=130.10 TRINITY_DN5712_c0_g1_i1:60-1808(+)
MSAQQVQYYAALKGISSTPASAKPAAPTASAPSSAPSSGTTAAPKKPSGADARKAQKAARAAQLTAAAVPQAVAVIDPATRNFGYIPLIRSEGERTTRNYVEIKDLEKYCGQTVWIRARLHNVRNQGKKSAFCVLRQSFNTVQLTAFVAKAVDDKPLAISAEDIGFLAGIPKESIIDVQATVVSVEKPIQSCTQRNIELHPAKVYCVSMSEQLPFQIDDAARPDPDEYAHGDAKLPEAAAAELAAEGDKRQETRVLQDTRLDYRWIDLRTPANQAIYRVQSMVGLLFREFLAKRDFIEIHTPKLIGAASEGGAAVFKLEYFGRPAFLAQSPQFYKQTAVCADLERVFEVGSVFRSENSNTHRHLCEFIGLDMEMTFKEHYYEVLDVIGDMFVYIFEEMEKRCAAELEAIRVQFPCAPLKFNKETLRFPYSEGVALLNAAGENLGPTDDINTAQEKKLGGLVKEKYGVDFFIMDKFPADVRPFYTMLDPKDPRFTNSYDAFIRGEEILSGAQRINEPNMLIERLKAKGVEPESVKSYVDCFRHGAPPHAGCGVGLERVTMLYLGLGNIRRTSMFPRDPRRLTP